MTSPSGPAAELLVPTAVRTPGTALYPAGSRIGPRLLEDFELVLVVTGSAELVLGDRRETLLPGSWVLARPGDRDTYAWDRTTVSRHLYVHFDLAPAVDVTGWPHVRHWPGETVLAAQFRRLVRLGADGDDQEREAWSTAVRLGLGALVAVVVGDAVPGRATARTPDDPVRRAVAHVRDRWDAGGLVPVSREELAAAAGVSVGHLSRLFRAEHGCGPARALELVRLARGLVLLRSGSMSVREVGAAVGFADQYHFSHRFRSVFGRSPSAYRTAAPADQDAVRVPPQVERLAQLLAEEAEPGGGG